MMFENRQQDFIPLIHIRVAPGSRDKIDRRRRARSENNFIVVRRVDELLDQRAGLFILCRSLFTEPVYPAMNIGVRSTITIIHRIQHRLRMLGRSPIVKIDEPAIPVNRLRQDWKIGSDDLRVKFWLLNDFHELSLALVPSATIPSTLSATRQFHHPDGCWMNEDKFAHENR